MSNVKGLTGICASKYIHEYDLDIETDLPWNDNLATTTKCPWACLIPLLDFSYMYVKKTNLS